jgi:hypothetical protein
MAKTTLTITIEVTAPPPGEIDWAVVAGKGNTEQYESFHAAKDRLVALGLPLADAVTVCSDALTEALGGAVRRSRTAVAAGVPNPQRVPHEGLRGRQREVLKKIVGRGSWNEVNPTWKLPTLSPSEIHLVLSSLQKHGYVERNDHGIWQPTKEGREYVGRPDPAVVAISSAPSAGAC